MDNYISISDARMQLPTLIDKVSKYLERYSITVNGKPKAVIISQEELDSIQETAEIMAIPGAVVSIKRGILQAKKGQVVPFEKIFKK